MKTPAEVKAFVDELRSVCRRHELSIGHEDSHGAFEVWPFDERHDAWLAAAEASDEQTTNHNPNTQSQES